MLSNESFNKNILINKYFYGAYINDVDKSNMYDCIILVYDYPKDKDFLVYDVKISEHKYYVGSYFPSLNKIVYVFNIPKEYKEEYIHILNGDISNISNNYKEKIKDFWKTQTIPNLLFKSFEQELFDIIEC